MNKRKPKQQKLFRFNEETIARLKFLSDIDFRSGSAVIADLVNAEYEKRKNSNGENVKKDSENIDLIFMIHKIVDEALNKKSEKRRRKG